MVENSHKIPEYAGYIAKIPKWIDILTAFVAVPGIESVSELARRRSSRSMQSGSVGEVTPS